MKSQLLLLATVLFTFSSVSIAETPQELAQFVVNQNKEARASFRSLHYHFVHTYRETAAGPKRILATFEGEWKEAGELRWMHVRRHSQYSIDPKDVQDDVSTLYVGSAISGKYVEGTSNPNEVEHADILRPNRSEAERIRIHFSSDPFLYTFAIYKTPLHEYFLKAGTVPVRWEAERPKPGSDGCFVLTRFLNNQPRLTCKIDPQRGWFTTMLDMQDSRGNPWLKVVSVPAQDPATQLWYPGKVEFLRYRPAPGGTTSLQSTTEITISDFHANVDFPPDQFTTASLGLPVGTQLIRETIDGKLAIFEQREHGLLMIRKPTAPGQPTRGE